MTTVIVPVGFDMGPVHADETPPARVPAQYEVHLGGFPEDLTAIQYTVWRAAFADPEAHAELKVDRERLEQYLRSEGHAPAGRVDDPGQVVDELLESGLLLEFDADGDLEDAFGVRRLYPTAPGLDSEPTNTVFHNIGFDEDDPACAVPTNVYTVWSFGTTSPSLWFACESAARVLSRDLEPGEGALSTAEVAEQVAYNLPFMLSTGVAFLDLLNYELPRIIEPIPWPHTSASVLSVTDKPPVIVPVGFRLGHEYFQTEPADRSAQPLRIHHGETLLELTDDEAAAWTAAFDDPLRHARHEVTRATLIDRLRREGLGDPDGVVTDLLDRGLLAEFEPIDGPLEDLFRAVQLYPMGEGQGNTAEQPGEYRIGVDGEMCVGVDPDVYTIWSYALTGRTLWSACVALAEGTGEDLPPGVEPLGLTPDGLARDVATVLPALIAFRCAYLDPLNYYL